MQLLFKTLSGIQLSCKGIANDATISQVKLLLNNTNNELAPPPENMRLIYCGKELQDSDVVKNVQIQQQSVIHVIDTRPNLNNLNAEELRRKINEIKKKQKEEADQQIRDAKIERDRRKHSQKANAELAKLKKIIEENSVGDLRSIGLTAAFLASFAIPVAGPAIAATIATGSAGN